MNGADPAGYTSWPTVDLLDLLRQRNVRLWVEEERLRFRAPHGALSAELRKEVKTRRDEIHELLQEARTTRTRRPAIEPVARGGELPLSFAQEQLWFLDRVQPGQVAYNLPVAVRLSGRLDLPVLAASLNEIVRRHEALRTVFSESALVEGQAVQVIVPPPCLDPPLADLSALDTECRETWARELGAKEVERPFDLARGPLVRTLLWRLAEDDHLLVVNMHHTVTDGWSMGVMLGELAAFYRGDSLPELPVQYTDYAVWQRGWLAGDRLERELEWWRQQLNGAPQALDLPTDRPRPTVQSHRGEALPVRLGDSLVRSLEGLSRQQGTTLFMTLLAAFQVLLSRTARQGDLLVGSPIANRNRAELEGLIGFFVNTLVLRADLRGDLTFVELLGRVRERTLGAYAHPDLPFEKLVDELQRERDPSRPPLFQAMFSLHNAPLGRLELPGLDLEPVNLELRRSKFDLSLAVDEVAESLTATWIFSTDLFDRVSVCRLAGHMERLLEAVVGEGRRQRLSSLPLLMTAERHQQLVEWNDQAEYGHAGGFCHLFEARVARLPEAVAVVLEEHCLSYGELNARANRLAHRLCALGVETGRRVGISVGRSFEMVVGILGILKSGGAYVPLEPSYPPERLSFMLEDAGIGVLVTQKRWLGLWSEYRGAVVWVDGEGSPAREASTNLESRIFPEHPAYVIYTSGSTGRPKGVVISHRALSNRVGFCAAYDFRASERSLQKNSISFDASVAEIFPPLAVGARMVVARPESERDSAYLVDLVRRERLTYMTFVPSVYQVLLEEPALARCTSLKKLLSGGEAMPARLPERLLSLLEVELHNRYGPTEATVAILSKPCRRGVASGTVPIGRPIARARIYLLGSGFRPVPRGVPGTLFIGGVCLAQGYLGRPVLTAEKFLPDPLNRFAAGERLFDTGDLGRYRADGEIDFLGRLDHQVKVRGFRIELGEIESALAGHRAVRKVTVLDREIGSGDKQLVAYVVGDVAAEELREYLKARLPPYMVPAFFVTLEDLPRTPNGKVDRQALPAPEWEAEGYMAPRNEAEESLARVWAEVLGVERIGVRDNFFEAGGDSVLSIQLVSRLRKAGWEVTPREVFQRQSVEELSQVARPLSGGVAEDRPAVGQVPLTPIQHWFFQQPFPERHHFNQSLLLELQEGVRPESLRVALGRLLEHHDALRLRFFYEDGPGTWCQENVAPGGAIPFVHVDLTGMEDWRGILEETASRVQMSLAPEEALLSRMVLFALPDGKPDRLLWVIHHLAVDGVSWRVLLEDLQELLQGEGLASRTTSFQSWARHLETLASSKTLEREAQLWLSQDWQRVYPLPTDRNGKNTRVSARTMAVRLESEETRILLEEVVGTYRSTVQDVLLAALVSALRDWTGSEVLLVNLEGHGRQEELFEGVDLSRTVGWFTSLYPVLLKAEKAPGELLKSVKEQLRAVPAGGVGYAVLRWLSAMGEHLESLPSAQVVFNYLGRLDLALPAGSLFTPARESSGRAVSAQGLRAPVLEVEGGVLAGCLELTWTYSENLHDRATVESLTRSFRGHLHDLLEHCRSPEAGGWTPSDFPLARLDQETLDRVLDRDVEDLYPLSPLQQGLLFHDLHSPGQGLYFERIEVLLHGPLQPEALRSACEAMVDRHPILRSDFVWRDLEEPLQRVRRRVAVPWEELDWRGRSAAQVEEGLEADYRTRSQRGFDLARAPLMGFTLIRTADQEYRFVRDYHHLLLDGWCAGVLFREALEHYRALARGDVVELPPVRPYREFIAWLATRDLAAAGGFWRRYLAGFGPLTLIAGGASGRGASAELTGGPEHGEEDLKLSVAASSELRSLASCRHLTVNTLVQGAWSVLLSRYTGCDDVIFGATVAGRPAELPGVESMMGLFINTLPVRVPVSRGEPVASWLQSLQARQAELRQYEHSPLSRVQSWSELPSGSDLFDHILVFENYPTDPRLVDAIPGLTLGAVRVFERTNYPLAILVTPGGRLQVRLQWSGGAFERTTLRRMSGHLRHLLQAVVQRPDGRLEELALLREAERHQLSVEWNDTAAACPRDRNLAQLFASQVERSPDAVAVVAGQGHLSYRCLEHRANGLGWRLRELGVGPDVPVGVCLERSATRVVGILGVLKAGGAYVPLDPDYPVQRLRFMVEDMTISVAVGRGAPEFSGASIRWVYPEAVEARESPPGPPHAAPENLAYVLYTSGSSGAPKGVAVPQRAVTRLVWDARYMRFTAREVFLQLAPIAFDASTLEIWGPLLHGGRLVMAARRLFSPRELESLLRRHRVSTLWLTAGLFHQVVEENLPALGSLRQLLAGGEALSPVHVRRVLKQLPEVRLINGYGPTENTTFTCCRPMDRASQVGATVSIGRPITNTGVFLSGPHLEPVPLGVPGELLTFGEGSARGYMNRPKLTATRFIPDACCGAGGRLYRTGDLARFLSGGNLEFLGRIDHQVKVRGFRVELGEIENLLAEHPGVTAAVVASRDQRLVAYVVARRFPGRVKGAEQEASARLRRHLQERLPDYMLPSFFLFLEELPLNANGKLDRRALPLPKRRAEPTPDASRTPTEELLAGIWAEVLDDGAPGTEGIGVEEDFFELGGHSLLATRVVSRIRQTFGVDVALRTLFENPTVAALARQVERASRTQLPPLRPMPRDEDLPLSFAQERLWFLDRLTPGSSVYNMPFAVRMRGALDVPALAASFDGIVCRHEALRTIFAEKDGRPVQVIRPAPDVGPTVVDLSGLPRRRAGKDPRENEARCLAVREARRAFDLSRGPLVRSRLCRLASEDHLLVVTLHHVVSDGWSVGVTVRELVALYRGERLPELPVQYADFALWQRGWLEGERLEQEVEWWRRQLDGAPQVLELPTDRLRPPARTHRGSALEVRLSSSLVRASERLSRRQGTTLFMTLLAAFQLLLSRTTHQDDLLVGSAIANRNQPEAEGLIGFFVNTLILRGDLTGVPTFVDLLGRVRERTLGAYTHQDLPFEKLVDELQPQRDPSRSPLFQVMFMLQNAPGEELELPGLSLSFPEVEIEFSKFDLTLSLTESGAGTLSYSCDLFDAVTLRRLWSRYERLLRELGASPRRRVCNASGMAEAERHQVTVEWNDTLAAWPRHRHLAELFESQVERTPEAVAVELGNELLSYGELDVRAAESARQLRRLRVGPEVRVAISLERCPELLAGLLGILKAGGAYVPLDPSYPEERLNFMLKDSAAAAVVRKTVRPLATESRPHPAQRASSAAPAPENLAYVIYTSGSTGRPKGAMNTHRAIINRLRWMQETYGLTAADRVLQKTPTSFDVSVWELFWPLMVGARVVMARPEGHKDSAYLAWLVAERKVTILHFVPSMLELFLGEPNLGACSSLRLVMASGEALMPRHERLFFKRFRFPARLDHLYGPTEAAVGVTYRSCSADRAGLGTIPIGWPLSNTRIDLLDRALAPVPVGVTGHLHIGGVQLGRGYLGRPARSAGSFVPDPFSHQPGRRLYRSGDLARYLHSGEIEFLGRIDHQVKVRGIRVELGEIESTLCRHPAVRTAVVVVAGHRLVCWVTAPPAGPAPLRSAELRAFMARTLPEHMVPSSFHFTETMPRLPNGKIDRRALSAVETLPSVSGTLAPRGPMEELLAQTWAEILGVERVGVRDNFFDLGGHSLLATRVTSRLRQDFQVELPLRSLFENPTVAGLARRIEAASRTQRPPITPVSRDADLPLSFAQERLWFLHRLEPDSAAYNVPAALRLEGVLNVPALAASLHGILRRHEALRTTFPEKDGRPEQVVHRAPEMGWTLTDLSGLTHREAEARRLALWETRRPFDLARGPLVRILLCRLAENDHLLVVDMHHIVTDGWSVGVIVRELTAFYRSVVASPADLPNGHGLPELPVQYADFAVWQRSRLWGEVLEREVEWWRQQLDGASQVLELPMDRPRPPVQSDRGASLSVALPSPTLEALKVLSRQQGTTLFMTLLATIQVLLSRITHQDDLLVGSPIANRNQAETEDLIGFFVNTLVLRGDLSGDPTFVDLLAGARERTLGAHAHQDLPFEKLVEQLQPERALARAPLFQVMFIVQHAPMEELELPGLSLSFPEMEVGTMKFDLIVSLAQSGQGWRVALAYCADLFDAVTMGRLGNHYQHLLEQLGANPRRPVGQASVISEAQRHQLAVECNDTAGVCPGDRNLAGLFEAQAARAPDAAALIFEERSFSYAELDGRANQAAHHLRRLGVGPGTMVGVHLERSPEMVMALLGIFKAGGAYVPLETTHPRERLEFMAQDAGARVVLTHTELSRERLAGEPKSALGPVSTAAGLAYTIYTSGSTGQPKGVLVRHEPAVNLVDWVNRSFGIGPGDRMLFMTSLGFDLSVYDVFGILAAGGSVRIASAEDVAEPRRLVDLLLRDPITFWDSAPAALQQLVPLFPAAGGGPGTGDLRLVFLSGDWIPVGLPDQVRASFPAARVIALGGATEATVWSNFFPVGQVDSRWTSIPYGRPIDNARYFISDARLAACPIGIAGDLLIGGQCLAVGYLNRPALTSERFVADPFSDRPGRRLYRTGDRARFLSDGTMEFLGRLDHQVKIRGFRIELGEVETQLVGHPEVEEAVVLVRDGVSQGKTLVAYVVPQGQGQAVAGADLGDFLKGKLPEYMVPSAFVMLDELPLTPNGKVDRRALPAPQWSAEQTSIAARTPNEKLLADIWAEVLRVERIGVEENFFEIGGHSLLATQIVSRVREAFRVELPLPRLFEAPTVAELAESIRVMREREQGVEAPPVLPVPRDRPLLLSFAQQRLWFLELLHPEGPGHLIPAAVRLEGVLEVEVLRRAFVEIVRRHEALRTTFAATDGRPFQMIARDLEVPLPVADLRRLPVRQRAREARRLVTAEEQCPFDLSSGPLVRVALLRMGEEDHILLITMHHIVSDGWSMVIFQRELVAVYEAFFQGRASPLAELPVQYADFAQWQRQWLEGEILDAHLVYWSRQLAGSAELRLPSERQAAPGRAHRGKSLTTELSAPLVEALRTLSRRQGATLFMTLLAAFQSLLYRHTGQDDIVVGTPVANRNRAEIEGLIGFFVNTVVLRVDLTGNPRFRELLARVREVTLGAYDHQDMPFEHLVKALHPERSSDLQPLFQAMFTFQERVLESARPSGLIRRPVDLPADHGPAGKIMRKLIFNLSETKEGIEGELWYSADLFDQTAMIRFLRHFQILLEGMVKDPEQRIGEPELMSVGERHQAFVEPAPVVSASASVAEAPRRQVSRHDVLSRRHRELSRRRRGLSAAKLELLNRQLRGKAPKPGEALPIPHRQHPRPRACSPVVKLQGAGHKPPFCCAHAIGGTVFCYEELARCLGPDQPFYAFEASGINSDERLCHDLRDMAAGYVEALVAVRPRDPYFLGGWSLGGVLAFEMARELRQRGAEIALLALFESLPPGRLPPESGAGAEHDEVKLLYRFARDLAGLNGRELRISGDELRAVDPENRLDHLLTLARRHKVLPADVKPEQARRWLNVYRTNLGALTSYEPRMYQGCITWFHSAGLPSDVLRRAVSGWGDLSTETLRVHSVPGDHYTMLTRPHVRVLAKLLKGYIDEELPP